MEISKVMLHNIESIKNRTSYTIEQILILSY
jgi:hypothetical protein